MGDKSKSKPAKKTGIKRKSTKVSKVSKASKAKATKAIKKTSRNSSDKKGYQTSIFIFHRAIRIDDNTGLISALKNSKNVLPIFIFTPEQIGSQNKFRSVPSIRFMIDSLLDLDSTLKSKFGSKIRFFYGQQDKVLGKILKDDKDRLNIEAVYVNMDYTPYALDREDKLADVCDSHGVDLLSFEDYLLLPIDTIKTGGGTFYSVYTPYYKNCITHNVSKPIINRKRNFLSSRNKVSGEIKLSTIPSKFGFKDGLNNIRLDEWPATRSEGLKRVQDIKRHKKYKDDRNDLTLHTTRLSAYIKFGIVSPREVYHRVKDLYGKKHNLIGQLFWRDFYFNLAYNKPEVLKGKSFREKYDKVKWKTNKKLLDKWKTGTTGIPIVDAGMRELVQSNYMHNRSRLITSNYLVKHYFIDWREGEKFYAENLVDYDPAVNNGNWQWTSGTGADAQPYFRLMNPWSQNEKFDKDCEYIKKWIPELEDVPPEDIRNWQEMHSEYPDVDYPAPTKDYDYHELKKEAKGIYSKAK